MKKELNIPVSDYVDDLEKVIKVLKSCETLRQVDVADRFSVLWLKKLATSGINPAYYDYLVDKLRIARNNVRQNIKKY